MVENIPHLGPLLSTWRGRLIVLVVVSQLLIPLTYYSHRDPHDERFAWRMFSPMRMAQCAPDLRIDGKSVDLGSEFHEAWIEIARRGRFRVLEQMAKRLCTKHPGSEVTLRLSCQYLGDPQPVVYGGFNMCVADEI